ncbi:cadherin-like domain-containing protein [Alcanivorax sp. DP30]|uniref:Ig-like domain-containing protein n=1 Tax=Alcanivorax sp. DP30 TaxID=2606217 RepID=UPI001F3242E3|nr:cadherin-like domain-containing protein [Alcanivorax sp. DP30]
MAIALATALMAGCGGGGSSSSGGGSAAPGTETPATGAALQGRAVKGPLVNAQVKAYAVDYDADDLIGAAEPVDTGATNNQAQITGINLDPEGAPYIIVVEADGDTTDLTTGAAPVITTMKTVVTAAMLTGNTPVVATPLTSLATEVAASKGATAQTLQQSLNDAQNTVKSTLGFGLDESVDIFTASPVITDETDTVEEQEQVAAYRLAVEAVSAVLNNAAADSSDTGDSATDVLLSMAKDLSDGVIDGKNGDQDLPELAGVDVSAETVANLTIPGTTIPVNTITTVLGNEAQNLGSSVTIDESVTVQPEEVATVADTDFDGVKDDVDNCINTKNADQLDANGNDVGAACEAAPQITAVSASGAEDSVINVALLASDAEGDALTFTVDGQVLPEGQSSYAYQPEADFSGQVVLPYSVTDGESSAVSTITIDVTPVNDPVSGSLVVEGAAEEGATLSLNNQMTDADGELTILSYQWFASGAPIAGATDETFIPLQAQVGAVINAEVVFSDGVFPEVTVPSAPTAPIANTINDSTGGDVVILGATVEGETLTFESSLVDPDGPVVIQSLQWLADEVPIAGQTGASLVLAQAQVGKVIRLAVTYSDGTFSNTLLTGTTGIVANVDNAATGAVLISGTPTEDQTLVAEPGFSDEDGLTNVEYLYQWFADGEAINDATSGELTLDDSHVGKAITVQVEFTDDLGGTETHVSEPTTAVANVNDPVQGTVAIAGTAMDTQVLSVENFLAGLSDDDGLPASVPPETSYQWKRNGGDIAGANAATYTLVTADVGTQITAEIQFPDNRGTTETVLSEAKGPVAAFNNLPTGSVTLTGDTQNQLWTVSNDLADVDGPATLVISYQWYADGSPIEGETGTTFTPDQAYVGASIFVRASYTDDDSNVHEVDSNATQVIDADDAFTGGVAIEGINTEDQTLTATNDLSDPDGEIVIVGYQWKASGADIAGATTDSLVLTQAEVGQNITVEVTFNDGVFGNQVALSSATTPVNNVNDLPEGEVTISGEPAPGNVLSASNTLSDEDGMGPVTYEWFVNAVSAGFGNTYDVQQADVGFDVYVNASYYDGQETFESVDSAAVTIEASAQAAAFDPARFSGQTVYDVYVEDGDDSECAGTTTFVRMEFDAGGTFDGTSACNDESISGNWAFEQDNQVLVLTSPDFDQPNYVTADADVVDGKQQSCWIDDQDILDSATALDICRNGEGSQFYSLADWIGYDAFYFNLADVHADTFDTKRFSHTWLAGRTLYDVWYGNVNDSNCELITNSDRGLSELVFSADGLSVDVTGIAGDQCDEPGISIAINADGQLGDSVSGAGINFLGNTDQYLEVVFRNEDGSPDNVDRFYHTLSEAQAAWNALPGAETPGATYTQNFQAAQLLKAPVYNVHSVDGDWFVEKIEFFEGGSAEITERGGEDVRFSDDGAFYSPAFTSYTVSLSQLSLAVSQGNVTWNIAADPNIGAGFMSSTGNGYEVCWGDCGSVETFFFSEESAQRYIDSQNTAGPDSPLLGSWLIDEGVNQRNILTFIDGSRYVVFHEHTNTDQSAGSAEYGTYTWDQETGDFTASATAQSDGEGGLDGAAFNLQVSGDAFTTDDGFGADRIVDATQPIVGSWILGEGDDLNILTFLSDTEYAIVHTQNQECYGDPCSAQELSGEFGFYSWDGFNFTVSSVSVDTNGPGGLYNNDDPADQQGESITINGNALTFTDADEGPFEFIRVGGQSMALVCGYESGWDDFTGKPLTFNSLDDYNTVVTDCDMQFGLPSWSSASLANKTFYDGEGEMTFDAIGAMATGLDYGDDEVKGTPDDEIFYAEVSDFATNQVMLEYSLTEGGTIEGYDLLTLVSTDGVNEREFKVFYEDYNWEESDLGFADTANKDGEIWSWTWYESDPNAETLGCFYESGWDDLTEKPLIFNSISDFNEVRSSCEGEFGTFAFSTTSLAGTTFYEEGNETRFVFDGTGTSAVVTGAGDDGLLDTGDDETFFIVASNFDTNVVKFEASETLGGPVVVTELWGLVNYDSDLMLDGKDFWQFRVLFEDHGWVESDQSTDDVDNKDGEIWHNSVSTASDFDWNALQP